MHWLVARPAPGDDPDLPLHGSVGPEDDERVVVDVDEVPVSLPHALERFLDEVVNGVDELLHTGFLSSSPRGGRRNGPAGVPRRTYPGREPSRPTPASARSPSSTGRTRPPAGPRTTAARRSGP